MRSLLDINVIIALLDRGHVMHVPDHAKRRAPDHVPPAYPNHRPVAQVAERLEEAFNHASHVFWPEQISLLKKGLIRWERMPR